MEHVTFVRSAEGARARVPDSGSRSAMNTLRAEVTGEKSVDSQALADTTADLVARAQERILGSGQEQYSNGDRQKFEDMPLDVLFAECQDEIIDTVNYCAMLWIRVQRLRDTIMEAEERVE